MYKGEGVWEWENYCFLNIKVPIIVNNSLARLTSTLYDIPPIIELGLRPVISLEL